MASYTDGAEFGPNIGDTPFTQWACTEVQYGPGFQRGRSKIDGGYAVLSGPGAAQLQILEVREIHEGEQNTVQADPGWGCLFSQPAGAEGFSLAVTVVYTP